MAYGPVGFRHRVRYRIRCVPLLSFRVGCVGGLSPKRLTQRQGGGGFRGPLSRKAGAVPQFARGHNSQLARSVRAWNMVWSTTEMHRTKTCSTCHVAIVRPRPIGSSNRLDDVKVLSVIIVMNCRVANSMLIVDVFPYLI